ncbi:MAG: hypothetical protein HWE27_12555 [Gammaproteobacteria bacterium]|nr:hypothetical protein [Gammaproteobacteria bacterium]
MTQKNSLLIIGGSGLLVVTTINLIALAFGLPGSQLFTNSWLASWLAVYMVFIGFFFAGIGQSLMKRQTESDEGIIEPKFKRYSKRMIVAFLLYVIAIVASHFLLKLSDSTVWHALIALLPVTPCFLMLRAIQTLVKEMDELQLRIFMESCLFALGWTAIGCISIGFLQFYKVIPTFSIFWVFSAICMLFGIGSAMTHRRYQ